jgi:D-beta-D-heptose 7-phosphate kinase/D-beta-D-heptose 1-phosphate adenosyltransferase
VSLAGLRGPDAAAGRDRPLVVLGDALLDRDVLGRSERLSPEAPAPVVDVGEENARPGGAGLAALLAARDGHSVVLVSAVGRDRAGERLRALLGDAGVALVDVGLDGPTPEKIRILADGHLLVRVDRGDNRAAASRWTAAATEAVASAGVVLVADYGRGLAARDEARAALSALPARVPVVWDPHPKGPAPRARCPPGNAEPPGGRPRRRRGVGLGAGRRRRPRPGPGRALGRGRGRRHPRLRRGRPVERGRPPPRRARATRQR